MGEILEFDKKESVEESTPVEEVVEDIEEEDEYESEEPDFDMNFFATPEGTQTMSSLLKSIGDTIPVMKEMWDSSKLEFNLTEDQMHAVAVYNREHITPPTEEEKNPDNEKEWNPFNGIEKMTEEDVISIFGEDHDIHGPNHQITVQRIGECYRDLYNWISTMKQYQETYDQWMQFQEMIELENINKLTEAAETIEDEKEKAEAKAAINNYWYMRNLGFLADPEVINDDIKKRIDTAYNDKGRIEYLMKRSLDKLPRLSIPKPWMLELNNFEKRFMDAKYSQRDDLLLLLVLQMLAFCDTNNANDKRGSYVYSILFGVDSIIRNACDEERKSAMLANIAAYEDSLLGSTNK